MRRFDAYKVTRGVNLADPDFWNPRLEDLDVRIAAYEEQAPTFEQAVEELIATGLERINDLFFPLYQQAEEALNNYGVSFNGESDTSLTVGTGQMTLTLSEATRQSFFYSDYVSLRAKDDNSVSMVAQALSYTRATGVFVVDVQYTTGVGTHASWDIHTGSPPDTTHAARTDNPHQVTAAQVGAPTTAAMVAAIAAAIAAIPPDSARLLKSANLSDLNDVGTARSNLGLGALAILGSVGYGNIVSTVLSLAADFRANSAAKLLTPNAVWASAAFVQLTDGANIAIDMSSGFNFYVTIAGNRTLANPTYVKVGQGGMIDVTQDGSGNHTLDLDTYYKTEGGEDLDIDLVAGRTTQLFYFCRSATEIYIGVSFRGVR